MFKRKYTATLLDSKWSVLKRDIKISAIPRRDEYIYMDNKYYEVINIVYRLAKNQDIFIIVEEVPNKIHIKNIEIQ